METWDEKSCKPVAKGSSAMPKAPERPRKMTTGNGIWRSDSGKNQGYSDSQEQNRTSAKCEGNNEVKMAQVTNILSVFCL